MPQTKNSAVERANSRWGGGGGLLDATGKPMENASAASPHDGGDGSMKFTLPDLRWNVALLNGLVAILFAVFSVSFLWFVDRIDDKFEGLSGPLTEVRVTVGEQKGALAAIAEGQRRIETSLEHMNGDQSQRSAQDRQAQPVREGTRGGR